MQVRRELRAALDVRLGHPGRRAAGQRAVGRQVDVGLVLAGRLGGLPFLGVGVVTAADQAFGLVLGGLRPGGVRACRCRAPWLVPTAGRRRLIRSDRRLCRTSGTARASRRAQRHGPVKRKFSRLSSAVYTSATRARLACSAYAKILGTSAPSWSAAAPAGRTNGPPAPPAARYFVASQSAGDGPVLSVPRSGHPPTVSSSSW